ncbi:MAG: iron-containing alcohol dehydrogenase [Gammaproteobacteria bacterium]|nr:iron-containing alcohol dehydrogenase [Gammaproteobacteria bacterium]MCP4880182.1 iron-containing alcohol dehydrogenase [Gammaproteobacteria bacterium]MDP6166360.1 iron-containing alcohol dehydrogenase [Gammaproteobacteria bacterium]
MNNLNANWNYPSNIRIGAGRVNELAEACISLNIRAPLLITDPGLSALPMIDEAVMGCNKAGLRCAQFSNVQGNPTGRNVEDGVVAYQTGNHDGVIAFGGGSALDAAKAVALMVGQTAPLWDFEDIGDNWMRVKTSGVAPIIAVPTTAGTGSEVGRAAVITDENNQVKRIIFHPLLLPSLVILDPNLTLGLPPHITAATGMDALSHSLEALCSSSYHPMAEGIAIEGIRLVKEYLPRAVANGQDLEARTHMLVASSMGATAFQKGLGGMHAIAHSLGALYNAHHGLLNAILMPYILQANQAKIEHKIERLGRYIGLPDTSFTGFFNWIIQLRSDLDIPQNLSMIGIDEQQSELVGRMSAVDPSASGNPVTFTAQQYADIFLRAIQGRLD